MLRPYMRAERISSARCIHGGSIAVVSPKEAEEIIRAYGAIITSSGERGEFARKKSYLPCSIGRLKHAYFTYIGFLVERRRLTQDVAEALVRCYPMMLLFLADADADEVNSGEHPDRAAQLIEVTDRSTPTEAMESEIKEYIAECYRRHGH